MNNLEEEIARLKSLIESKDEEINKLKQALEGKTQNFATDVDASHALYPIASVVAQGDALTKDEVARYSRQLILPQVGAAGQKRLRASSVLLVGAGGLGCPAGIYLAAAGVGRIGIVDYDLVELSNLHRQICHQEASVGTSKAGSLARAIRSLNSTVNVMVYDTQFDRSNATRIVSAGYDVVLDCSDNPATRYLVNDACVLSGRPLVSGSALRWEGQLTVYNHQGGPCYRCLYPLPADPKFVTNCSDGGVIGAVPGLVGTLQAIETIKLLLGPATSGGPSFSQRLLVIDAENGSFRSVNLRPKQANCAVCSEGSSKTIRRTEDVDYALFCGRGANDKEEGIRVLSGEDRVTPAEFRDVVTRSSSPPLLIDVRPELETSICRLAHSVCIPYQTLGERTDELRQLIGNRLAAVTSSSGTLPVFVVCRRGNNSQLAVEQIRSVLPAEWPVFVRDIVGGLTAWAEQVDPDFPIY